jgi:hypothetical protein
VRIGSSNIRLPEHLVADLVLGRRRRPVFGVGLESVSMDASQAGELGAGINAHLVRLALVIENVSFVPADDVRIGLATWHVTTVAGYSRPLPRSLRSSLTLIHPVEYVPTRLRLPWLPALIVSGREPVSTGKPRLDKLHLGAFDLVFPEALWPFAVPLFPNHLAAAGKDLEPELRRQMRGFVRLRAGLFVIARDAAPQWYQLTFDYESRPEGGIATRGGIAPSADGRPVVSVEFLPEDAP